MESSTPLTRHVEGLPADWKWEALFVPPTPFEGEWRTWLAEAQREEEAAMLRHWAKRRQVA